MKVDSALELQARIFSQIFEFVEAPVVGRPGISITRPVSGSGTSGNEGLPARRKPRHRAVEDIALGITADEGRDDARLAILVQDRRKVNCSVVEQAVEAARGEAEVLYIGRQKPLWTHGAQRSAQARLQHLADDRQICRHVRLLLSRQRER
ncbi:MAG: hypothetical protein KL801_05740 [Mesorhizobium sp.]|nr:hypothetical protein [Mesorhizobium sp.]